MGDYYNDYSLILFFVYAMSIAILWAASGDTSSSQTLIKRILYPMAFAWIAFGVIEFIYFFPFAAAMSLSAGLFIFSAIIRMEINARQQY